MGRINILNRWLIAISLVVMSISGFASNEHQQLCDRPLDQIVFAGRHNLLVTSVLSAGHTCTSYGLVFTLQVTSPPIR